MKQVFCTLLALICWHHAETVKGAIDPFAKPKRPSLDSSRVQEDADLDQRVDPPLAKKAKQKPIQLRKRRLKDGHGNFAVEDSSSDEEEVPSLVYEARLRPSAARGEAEAATVPRSSSLQAAAPASVAGKDQYYVDRQFGQTASNVMPSRQNPDLFYRKLDNVVQSLKSSIRNAEKRGKDTSALEKRLANAMSERRRYTQLKKEKRAQNYSHHPKSISDRNYYQTERRKLSNKIKGSRWKINDKYKTIKALEERPIQTLKNKERIQELLKMIEDNKKTFHEDWLRFYNTYKAKLEGYPGFNAQALLQEAR